MFFNNIIKVCGVAFVLTILSLRTTAQKPALDLSVQQKWPILSDQVTVSNDGNYVSYWTTDYVGGASKFFIRSTRSSWQTKFEGDVNVIGRGFSGDGRYVALKINKDSLQLLQLSDKKMRFIAHVVDAKMPKKESKWLAYKDNLKNLTVINLVNQFNMKYTNVEDFTFSDHGRVLLIETSDRKLVWLDLLTGKGKCISNGGVNSNYCFDLQERKLVFLTQANDNVASRLSYRYYKIGQDSASTLVADSSPLLKGFSISLGKGSFNKNGSKFLFFVKQEINDSSKITKSSVNIRNSVKDESSQLKTGFLAIADLAKRFVILAKTPDNPSYMFSDFFESDYILTYEGIRRHVVGNTILPNVYLTSIIDGSCELLLENPHCTKLNYSSTGKYIIWYDQLKRNWFTYNCIDRSVKNISQPVSTQFFRKEFRAGLSEADDFMAWMDNDSAVFLYDRRDIWRVDPDGAKTPVNITDGYGIKHNIRFRPLRSLEFVRFTIHSADTLILAAFNESTKDDGFFKLILNRKQHKLQKLTMEPRLYHRCFDGDPNISGVMRYTNPIKAANADNWVVCRMSEKECPNLFVTNNFKKFKAITYSAPQTKYNWYRTQLITWPMLYGKTGQGILYKPENFDITKKYPVIFYYYEKNSQGLHYFLNPELNSGILDIPRYVSNGYLVFVPDMTFLQLGFPGESVLNTVSSAADYLCKLPYVNAKKMGLQGHSYGGWETNYIVTHTTSFSAAAPASGVIDYISSYLQNDYQDYYEIGQGKLEKTLWQTPDRYISNSPVFNADKVETPILIMHGSSDPIVPFSQGEMWYNALKRLGKKAWMLSYRGEGHTLGKQENQMDYSIRLSQFFDHYLKDKPAPYWMIGRGNGFGLDSTNVRP